MKKLPTMAHNSDNDELELFSPPDRLLEVDYDEGERKKSFTIVSKSNYFQVHEESELTVCTVASEWKE